MYLLNSTSVPTLSQEWNSYIWLVASYYWSQKMREMLVKVLKLTVILRGHKTVSDHRLIFLYEISNSPNRN